MLYLIATPIGNLSEITFRAVEILKKVDYIACEDTRTSKILLNTYKIRKPLLSYHKFNEKKRLESILCDLKNGQNIAIISDAGMPGICDPGNVLIKQAIENNIEFTVISGACALINAFVMSGFNMPFTFCGFLPEKTGEKKKLFTEFSNVDSALIFYVSSHEIIRFFEDAYKYLGDRKVCVTRELTKKFEEQIFTTLQKGYDGVVLGEFVVIVDKPHKIIEFSNLTVQQHVNYYMDMGLSKNEAIKTTAKDRKLKKNLVYKDFVK